jgi:hypothetical protein
MHRRPLASAWNLYIDMLNVETGHALSSTRCVNEPQAHAPQAAGLCVEAIP